MWTIQHGPIPPGVCICHRCDVPACYEITHLFAGTNHDNIMDSVRKGRHKVPLAAQKLTDADVRAIRRSPISPRKLAPVYGVAHSLITRIRRREAWSHVV